MLHRPEQRWYETREDACLIVLYLDEQCSARVQAGRDVTVDGAAQQNLGCICRLCDIWCERRRGKCCANRQPLALASLPRARGDRESEHGGIYAEFCSELLP